MGATGAGLKAVARGPLLAQLRRLDLSGCGLGRQLKAQVREAFGRRAEV
jgi:hypothetical protein